MFFTSNIQELVYSIHCQKGFSLILVSFQTQGVGLRVRFCFGRPFITFEPRVE